MGVVHRIGHEAARLALALRFDLGADHSQADRLNAKFIVVRQPSFDACHDLARAGSSQC